MDCLELDPKAGTDRRVGAKMIIRTKASQVKKKQQASDEAGWETKQQENTQARLYVRACSSGPARSE